MICPCLLLIVGYLLYFQCVSGRPLLTRQYSLLDGDDATEFLTSTQELDSPTTEESDDIFPTHR